MQFNRVVKIREHLLLDIVTSMVTSGDDHDDVGLMIFSINQSFIYPESTYKQNRMHIR